MTMSSVPDSPIALAATELLVASSPPTLVNHCLRTYHFGLLLADLDGLDPDREALYVGAALHDLGLTERFAGSVPFERHGADVAHEFLLGHRYPADRADLIADAIRWHVHLEAAQDSRPEVVLLHLGATIDVFGIGLDRIPAGTTRRILAEHPRLGFTKAVVALLTEQAERLPDSRAAELIALGAADRIAAAPYDD